MTILCDRDIQRALDKGHLEITPRPQEERISTSAIDLTLSAEFRRWRLAPRPGLEVAIDPSAPDYNFTEIAEQHTESIPADQDGSIVLKPGAFVLAQTAEKVNFPRKHRLAARVEGRSSLARLGVGVHLTAPTIHSGYSGRITLEITNQGTLPVRLRPGQVACQLIVERLLGTPSERAKGTFIGQTSPTGRAPKSPAEQRPLPRRRPPKPKAKTRKPAPKRGRG